MILQPIELNAFLAALEDDESRCRQLLSALPPNELHNLRCAASLLRSIAISVHPQIGEK